MFVGVEMWSGNIFIFLKCLFSFHFLWSNYSKLSTNSRHIPGQSQIVLRERLLTPGCLFSQTFTLISLQSERNRMYYSGDWPWYTVKSSRKHWCRSKSKSNDFLLLYWWQLFCHSKNDFPHTFIGRNFTWTHNYSTTSSNEMPHIYLSYIKKAEMEDRRILRTVI